MTSLIAAQLSGVSGAPTSFASSANFHGTLWPITQVIIEAAEQDWTQYWPLDHTIDLQLDFMPLITTGSQHLFSHSSAHFIEMLL